MLRQISVLLFVCLPASLLLDARSESHSPQPPDRPCPVGAVLVPPQLARSHLAEIPPTSPANRGTAVVDIQVDEEGRVCFVSLRSADPEVDYESAASWVRQWRFSPFLLAGFPIQAATTIPVHFGRTPPVSMPTEGKTDDLCERGSLCLFLKPDGTLLKNGKSATSTDLEDDIEHVERYILIRPDPATPFVVARKTWAALKEQAGPIVRFWPPYYLDRGTLVRLPGPFIKREEVIQAARQLRYQVMRMEIGVAFPEDGVTRFSGGFTVNLAGTRAAAKRMESLTYQGPPGTPSRPWPEEWLYEFEVDADGSIRFQRSTSAERETELDKAVMKRSDQTVSPTPYPAPARVLVRIGLAR